MKKDIFIDSQIANKFAAAPLDLKELIEWLYKNDEANKDDNAHLVVSNSLIVEYFGGNRNCFKRESITVIYNKLMSEDRIVKKTKNEIDDFIRKYCKPKIIKKLKSNAEDRKHIPIIFLSDRRMALIEDNNFIRDLMNFTCEGTAITVARSPNDINYK